MEPAGPELLRRAAQKELTGPLSAESSEPADRRLFQTVAQMELSGLHQRTDKQAKREEPCMATPLFGRSRKRADATFVSLAGDGVSLADSVRQGKR